MTHPMNSNPWPAAFVNFKASIQVVSVSIPGNQSFLEWRMELLTEQHAVAHMTNAMNDIMAVGLSSKLLYPYCIGLNQSELTPPIPMKGAHKACPYNAKCQCPNAACNVIQPLQWLVLDMRCATCLFALYIWWLMHRTLRKHMNLNMCTVGLPELVAPALQILANT